MYKVLSSSMWNLKIMRRNPRVWMCLCLAFLSAYMMTRETIETAVHFGTDIQMLEAFIWCFSDGENILFASFSLMLILTQMPDANEMMMFRVGRRAWVLGQILSAVILSFLYTLFLLAATMLLSVGQCYAANRWSDTAFVLSYAEVQVLTVARRVIKVTTPWFCMGQIFLLTIFYMLILTMLKLFLTLCFGRRAGICGIVLVSLYGFLLTPDWFMTWFELPKQLQFYANRMAVWASPLQHASYGMHSFGYDELPTLGMSYGMMGGAVLLLAIGSYLCRRAGGSKDE